NGMATAADWMSAASFISMAGIISFAGYDGSVYLMGWTGGYVLLALLLAPYLRKFGKFTVPDFVGDRYYSQTARIVAVICALFVSFTYVAGQMRGVGVVFSQFLNLDITTGVLVGMAIVFVYAVLGGMKGITYTQVAQYCVLIFAFTVPAIFISIMLTGNPVPQAGFVADLGGDVGTGIAARLADGVAGGVEGAQASGGGGIALLEALDRLNVELGFDRYTDGTKSTLDVFMITMALMVGTAGLPHVIIRFYTVPRVRDARLSAFYALLFIGILYTMAPAVGAFARTNLIDTIDGAYYSDIGAETDGLDPASAKVAPAWFKEWEAIDLLAWTDKNGDGVIQYRAGAPFEGKPKFAQPPASGAAAPLGPSGERLVINKPTDNENELFVDRDIMVLANPQIANLPYWVIGLVAAGGLAAALSTAAGLLLVISTAVSHDLLKRVLMPNISEKNELWAARIAAAVGVALAGLVGIYPPDYVAAIVALAFGLAASSFFPAIILGIFSKRMNREGAVSGMVVGLTFTIVYILMFKFPLFDGVLTGVFGWDGTSPKEAMWLFGISPEGIGTIGMCINFAVSLVVGRFFPPPPIEIQELVENIRVPTGAGEAHEMQVPPAHE
ncbi:MAG: sodium:solute symporter family protein, partial [Planctomycetota bacterium]